VQPVAATKVSAMHSRDFLLFSARFSANLCGLCGGMNNQPPRAPRNAEILGAATGCTAFLRNAQSSLLAFLARFSANLSVLCGGMDNQPQRARRNAETLVAAIGRAAPSVVDCSFHRRGRNPAPGRNQLGNPHRGGAENTEAAQRLSSSLRCLLRALGLSGERIGAA
jgi:hypothetical protein